MKISFALPIQKLEKFKKSIESMIDQFTVATIALVMSIVMTSFAFMTDTIVAYGDAESHLDVYKRQL